MPVLDPLSPVVRRPRRVVVAGTSGSGKTTLAARVATLLSIDHVEIDALHHGPGWQPMPDFDDRVHRLVQQATWVTEWQYTTARERLAQAADLMLWLDLPRHVVMRQVTTRTVDRRLRRTTLWHGNREGPLREAIRPDGVIGWAWQTYDRNRGLVLDVAERRPTLDIVRLRSHDEADAWLRALRVSLEREHERFSP